jgi:acetyl/propionyl-CoA carboxylase alpha subunit
VKREILIEGKLFSFSFGRTAGRESISTSNGTHEVRYHRLPDGRRLCIVDGRVVEWSGPNGDSLRLVRSGGQLHHLEVRDPRREKGSGIGHEGVGGRVELAAPMPGKVVSVLKQAGDEIEAGKGIVVLEAMKMENELRSPITGRVTMLGVKPGESVETGQLIAVVEPPSQG